MTFLASLLFRGLARGVLPLLGAVVAPVAVAAGLAWLAATMRSAGAAHQQARNLVRVVEEQRARATRLSAAHAALRRAEAAARSEVARSRDAAVAAHRRIEAAPRTETNKCPIDCRLSWP